MEMSGLFDGCFYAIIHKEVSANYRNRFANPVVQGLIRVYSTLKAEQAAAAGMGICHVY